MRKRLRHGRRRAFHLYQALATGPIWLGAIARSCQSWAVKMLAYVSKEGEFRGRGMKQPDSQITDHPNLSSMMMATLHQPHFLCAPATPRRPKQ